MMKIKMLWPEAMGIIRKIKTRREVREYVLCAYLVAFLFMYIFYKNVVIAAVAAVCILFSVSSYEQHLKEKRKELLKLQFRDLLYSMSASYASGRQLGEALQEGYENLQLLYEPETPIMQELVIMNKSINENHGDECSVLQDFAKRNGIEDIQDFADIYSTCRATGGNIEKVIDKTAIVLIEKLTIEREIRAYMTQKKLEGIIIFIMPLAVIFLLNFISPDYLAIMYECMRGRIIMTLGLLGMLYAGSKIKKISDVRM